MKISNYSKFGLSAFVALMALASTAFAEPELTSTSEVKPNGEMITTALVPGALKIIGAEDSMGAQDSFYGLPMHYGFMTVSTLSTTDQQRPYESRLAIAPNFLNLFKILSAANVQVVSVRQTHTGAAAIRTESGNQMTDEADRLLAITYVASDGRQVEFNAGENVAIPRMLDGKCNASCVLSLMGTKK